MRLIKEKKIGPKILVPRDTLKVTKGPIWLPTVVLGNFFLLLFQTPIGWCT